jgi:hypothetical protein
LLTGDYTRSGKRQRDSGRITGYPEGTLGSVVTSESPTIRKVGVTIRQGDLHSAISNATVTPGVDGTLIGIVTETFAPEIGEGRS